VADPFTLLIPILHSEYRVNFFRIVMFVKRNSLPRCHSAGKNAKILGVPVRREEKAERSPGGGPASAEYYCTKLKCVCK